MAEFLYSTFQDDKAQLWRIEIHDTDFSGSSTEFHVAADGFQLKYQGDTEKPLQPVVGSTLSFVMQIEDGAQGLNNSTTLDGFLSTLLTADEDRFTVVVREGALSSDDVYWVGIIQPEQMIIADESYPRSVEVIAAAITGGTNAGAATGPLAPAMIPAFVGTLVGGVMSAFAAIPAFADGGVVSGPTMGLMGEYSGARNNPEVIAPLDKLRGMIADVSGGGNNGGVLSTKVKGSDLVFILERGQKQVNRNR